LLKSSPKTQQGIKKYFNLDNIVDTGVDVSLVVFDVLSSPILIVMRVVRWFLNEFVLGHIKRFIKFIVRIFMKLGKKNGN
tara:strand:- start:1316 stop:1555 length:240 start_codon:yes stop_codon:yes gene_type:complete